MRSVPSAEPCPEDRFDGASLKLYVVHMKRVTASEARRNWFKLLDDVVRGERVVIERRGRRIVLLCEDQNEVGPSETTPDYGELLQVADADDADRWSWSWSEDGLEPVNKEP